MPIYMKYEGIDGPLTGKYKGWIELESAQLGTHRSSTSPTGRGEDRDASVPSVSEIVVTKLTDSGRIAEELYLGILTRLPDAGEKATFTEYLTKHSQRRDAAIGELAWALLTSAEFRLNH